MILNPYLFWEFQLKHFVCDNDNACLLTIKKM